MRLFGLILLFFIGLTAHSQRNVTTLGLQIKPIVPSKFFDSGTELIQSEFPFYSVQVEPKLGWNFGMLVRQGFTDMFSLEVGINMVRRNYKLQYWDSDFDTSLGVEFAFVSYEVPIQGLIYVKLGEQFWMNAAAGFSFDTYPSNVFTTTDDRQDTLVYDFQVRAYRTSWVQMAVLANVGFEWRTKDKGYWYLGASYHRPFRSIATAEAKYIRSGYPYNAYASFSGSYLTLDLRYFFHEDEQRQVKVKTRPPK
jgi:hypothetical protein